MYMYINGEFALEEEVKISPFDHGFLYGLGVFETFRIYDGHPFLLDDHFHRLSWAAKELNIELSLTRSELKMVLAELLRINEITNAYIRLNISAGVSPIGLSTEPYCSPNILIFIKPIHGVLPLEKKAEIVKIARNSPEGEFRLKSHHYLNNILAKRELSSSENEGVFLNEQGFVSEGIVSNIFWVKDGQVYTPDVKTGILNGITRQLIVEILKKNNFVCNEGFYPASMLLEANEVFITNSIQEVVSILQLNNHVFARGEITNFLQNTYQGYIKKQLRSITEM